jgi:hypothetical protein
MPSTALAASAAESAAAPGASRWLRRRARLIVSSGSPADTAGS